MTYVPYSQVRLRYTSCKWVRLEGENEAVMGMTSTKLLGDMVFVDLPIPGNIVLAGEDSVIVESVKTPQMYLRHYPEKFWLSMMSWSKALINQDPYGAGWLFRLEAARS